MDFLVIERLQAAPVVESQLGIKQLIADACRLRVLVDTFPCRLVQGFAVRCQPNDIPVVTGGLAYFQAVLVLGIVNAEHVYQLQFQGREVFHRHSF